MSTSSYAAWPIDPRSEIRIIELLPPASPESNELHCNLLTAKLSDKPAYEALSYTWGDPIFPEVLQLPTGFLLITSNLASALRRLRHLDRPRRLWVDAVCINQQDSIEKGHQVSLMAEIYTNTTCVLGWLGEGNEQTQAAISILKDIVKSCWKFGINADNPSSTDGDATFDNYIRDALRSFSEQLDWQAINTFFAQPWFHRLWIVQEVALAPCLKLLNGLDSLNSQDLAVIYWVFMLNLKVPDSTWNTTANSDTDGALSLLQNVKFKKIVDGDEPNRANGVELSLLSLVKSNAKKGCKNDMDRIYALLGLRADADEIIVNVDYGGTVNNLYTEFAIKYLEKNNLQVLHSAGKRYGLRNAWEKKNEEINSSSALPSWVPDWRLEQNLTHMSFCHENFFEAATKLAPTLVLEKCAYPFIGVAGVVIDTVEKDLSHLSTSDSQMSFSIGDLWEDDPQQIRRIRTWITHSGSKRFYPNGEKMATAFARTMVMDNRSFITMSWLGCGTTPQTLSALCSDFEEAIETSGQVSTGIGGGNDTKIQYLLDYAMSAQTMGHGRNLLITNIGYLGLGPLATRPGDTVVIFDGAETPFVLRQIKPRRDAVKETLINKGFDPEEQWELVGDCYLHGFMDNEVLRPLYRSRQQTFWIT